jgi:hypothetical protein
MSKLIKMAPKDIGAIRFYEKRVWYYRCLGA